MKNTRKKGFTIVELVIVIAVIAILAAVLIPTFSNVIENAKKSAALSEAKNAWTEYLASKGKDIKADEKLCIESDGYYFHVENGKISEVTDEEGTTHTCTDYTKMKVNDKGVLETVEAKTDSNSQTPAGGDQGQEGDGKDTDNNIEKG